MCIIPLPEYASTASKNTFAMQRRINAARIHALIIGFYLSFFVHIQHEKMFHPSPRPTAANPEIMDFLFPGQFAVDLVAIGA